jgi:DASS family divalent anion:Na+ symporter
MRPNLVRWIIVLGVGVGVAMIPVPEGITREARTLLAVFLATIAGSIAQPLPDSAIVLLGVTASVVFGALKPSEALSGYSDPVVWICLAALFLSNAIVKSGLGRRIALLFVRTFGKTSLGLGYSLVSTDFVLASVVPANSARNGGILLPIVEGITTELGSRPEDGNAGKIGTFLVNLLYQSDVIICATFLTGQAGNFVLAKLAKEKFGIEITYSTWLIAGIVPALVSLIAVPLMIYRFFPPGTKFTPEAPDYANLQLKELGRMTTGEKITALTLISTVFLWATKGIFHDIDAAIVAFAAIGVLLISRVLAWKEVMAHSNAWSVFIWYGGLFGLATALGNTSVTTLFAAKISGYATGLTWTTALIFIVLIYFYVHYMFASITAHALALFVPFLAVAIATGAPTGLALLSLIFASNLSASLTNYGTTPGPIYFAAGYVRQGQWWTIGFIASVLNILIWSVVGLIWWKVLGWW